VSGSGGHQIRSLEFSVGLVGFRPIRPADVECLVGAMTGALWEWLELDVAEGDAFVAVGLQADKAGGLVLG
jgi:hypothetical protein